MKQTLEVINRMQADGIIGRYAIAGAVAAYNYVEPSVTDDLDILVSFDAIPGQPQSGLITLSPIFSYLQDKGYSEFHKEGLVIEGWPVQFLPVASDLDAEALARAEEVEVEMTPSEDSVKTRVLRPEHIVATALRIDRPRDRIRITQFLEEQAVDLDALCDVVDRHRLRGAWRAYCERAGISDPLRCTSEAMKDGKTKVYPDVSDILARKAEGRRDISRRTFGEKIAMVEALRERLAPLKRARERRIAAKRLQQGSTGPRE